MPVAVFLFVGLTGAGVAAPLTLTGSFLQVGISDYGTFGSNGSAEPGLLHDPTGKRNFAPNGVYNDYLTPGTPHDGFIINSTQTGAITNDNDGIAGFGTASPTLLTGPAAKGYSNAASWSSIAGRSVLVTNSYYFNQGDERIAISSTITALTDLTQVAFGRSEDPDPDVNLYGTYDTINTRGDSATAPQDLVSGAGFNTGLTIGILNTSGSRYPHNTQITSGCCSNADPYSILASTQTLAYPRTTTGDYGLQIAWLLGDMTAGQSLTVTYDYVFGTHQGDVSTGGDRTINTTGGDLAPDRFSLGSPAATSPNVVFDGGTLVITGGAFPGNVISAPVMITARDGTIDTGPGNGGFSGSVTGPGSLTITGGGIFALLAANDYAGGTIVTGSSVAVGDDAALGTGPLTLSDGRLLALIDGIRISNDAVLLNGGGTGDNAIDTQAFGLRYAGAISGGGDLVKLGAGTLLLTGANTYTGGTTVAAGTLQIGDGGTTGSIVGDVANSASLVFARSDAVTYGGVISGPGSLTQAGAGRLTLTGANTYTGGTTVAAGTLQIGDGGTTGSIVGDVADSASLVFARSDAVTYGGAISGPGSLTQAGPGRLTLTGANGYTGGTIVAAGTLQIGDGGTTGSIVGDVADSASLVFARSDAVTYGGVISGPGSLTQAGPGRLTLTGANTYTGGTTVAAGTLQIGGGGTTGSIVGDVADSASLVFARSDAVTYGGVISGPGSLTQAGPGRLTLTGANSYTGGTTVAAGTLQIGDGGTTGSIVGDVADSASLVFARSDAVTYGGVISGPGLLTQAGAGTLTLTGINTYTGQTVIAPGTTLALAGGGSIAASGGIVDGGTLDLSASGGASFASLSGGGAVVLGAQGLVLTDASGTFSGAIGGRGSLALLAGSEVLTGADTYTGGTTIGRGATLQIGDGGTAGSIRGDVADAGLLAFDRTGALAFAGRISGDGAVAKAGGGTLSLTGDNSYSGGTFLRRGTLAIGGGTALGTGALSMDDGTALRFTAPGLTLANAIVFTGVADPTVDSGAGTATLAGDISGAGALTKAGRGTLVLAGTDTATGATRVAAGTLEVDGAAESTAVAVAAGATLSGAGSVGSIAARGAATVAPGSAANPYGTLRTPGSASFAQGATFRVAVDAQGRNSALAVGGTATLGGAAVAVSSAPGTYDASTRYTILTAAGGVQGAFGSLSTAEALAFLSPYLTYGADAVTLNFRANGTSFADVAATPNERRTALALQSLDPAGALVRSLQGLSPDAARRALDALAGATHASAATAAAQGARRVSTEILGRLWNIGGGEPDARTLLQQLGSPSPLPAFVNCFAPVEAPPPRAPATVATAWGEGFGDFGHDGADRNGAASNGAGLDRNLGGFILGYDAPLLHLGTPYRIGVAGGYTNDAFSGTGPGGSGSRGTFESVFGSIYGGARYGAVDLRLGAAVAGTSSTVNRTISYPGTLDGAHSVYGGNTEQVFGELGYRFTGPRWVVEPVVDAAYIHVHQDGYRERGGPSTLIGFAQDDDVGTTTLGARAEAAPFVGVPLVARAFLGWRHAFGDVDPGTRLAFQAGSIPFTAQGAALDRDALAGEAGLDWRFSGAVTLGISYVGQVGPRDSDNGVKGRFEYKF